MSVITYGFPNVGAFVTLQMVRTRHVSRRPKYSDDNTTYLYTIWHIEVTAVINPYATAYTVDSSNAPVRPQRGQRRALTDAAIRHLMLQPRGVFQWLDDDGNVLVQCPRNDQVDANGFFTPDSAGGPFPRAFDIIGVQGTESYLVSYAIDLHVNECESNNIILSHRWTMNETITDRCLSIRHVESDVDFDIAALFKFGVLPDQLRPLLIHQTPLGWKREHLDITQSSDWSSMHIASIDRQLTHSWKAGLIDVKATSIRSSTQGGRGPLEVYNIAQAGFQTGLAGALIGAIIGESPQVAGNQAGGLSRAAAAAAQYAAFAALGLANAALRQGIAELPQHAHTIVVEALGGPESKRWDVENAALSITLAGMTAIDPQFAKRRAFLPVTDLQMVSDLAGKYCQVRLSVRYGPGSVTRGFGAFMLLGAQQEPPDYEILRDKNGKPLITTEPLPIQGPANCLGTRTTWLGALVANMLQLPCAPPGAPLPYVFPRALVPTMQQGDKVLQQQPPEQTGGAQQGG